MAVHAGDFPAAPQIDPARFEVATALELAPYTFASTMPETPHYYSHRRRFVDQDLFGRVVKQVRYETQKRAYIHGRSGNRYWTDYWSANGYQYWVVDSDAPGCPDSRIGVMNRDFRRYPEVAAYDRWAPTYDQSFVGRHNVQETRWWMRRMSMPREGQRLLDVGCGTGMLVDYRHRSLPPERYVGIDPSEAMLARFASKHPGFAARPRRNLLRTSWQDYVPVDWDRTLLFDGAAGPQREPKTLDHLKFRYIAALFGVASYIPAAELVPGVIGLLARDGLALLVCYRSKDLPRNRRQDVGVEEMPEIKTDVDDLESEFERRLGSAKRLVRRVEPPWHGNFTALEIFNRWM